MNAHVEDNILLTLSNDATQTQSRLWIAESQQCFESGTLKMKISLLHFPRALCVVREYLRPRLFRQLPRTTIRKLAKKAQAINERYIDAARFSCAPSAMSKQDYLYWELLALFLPTGRRSFKVLVFSQDTYTLIRRVVKVFIILRPQRVIECWHPSQQSTFEIWIMNCTGTVTSSLHVLISLHNEVNLLSPSVKP